VKNGTVFANKQTNKQTNDCLKLSPLTAALLVGFAAFTPVISIAAEPRVPAADAPTSSKDFLPDFGNASPGQPGNIALRPSASGVGLESNFGRQKLIVTPEYSNQTGLSVGGALASMLGDNAAVGVLFTAGADKKEWLLNAGFKLDERQRFVVTAGQLQQFLDYAFRSGTEKVGMTQNSGAVSYQLQLGKEFLRFLEANGYVAKTASRDLADKTFAVDTATIYELWNDPRRIAGGKVTGLQGRLGFTPFAGSLVKVSLGQERLSYDLFSGNDSVNRFTGGLEWLQQLGHGYTAKASADAYASQNRYTLGIERSLSGSDGRHNIGASAIGVRGRDGIGNDNLFLLTYRYVFGVGSTGSNGPALDLGQAPKANTNSLAEQTAAWSGSSLLDQVAQRPSFIPSRVVAKIDNSALPTRLIAVDKTALPAGSTVNPANGDITTPLGVAVVSIASVTKNLAAFSNTGQFSLSGNSLVIKPSLIEQPAVGVVDSYVVTFNNAGGGTTLATVRVSHGSTKIDSVTITAGASAGGDTAAPVTTVAPAVSGISATAATLSVTINESGTGYYLVQPAATAAPTVAATLAGTAFAMSANLAATTAISGLTASTAYKVYFVAKDVANNIQAAVQSVALTTTAGADITPPTTTVAPSISTAATAFTAGVTQTINENGTGYYLVQAAAAAAPTVAAVKAGTAFAMTANTPAVVSLTGLASNTAYKYYFVAKDAANNDQAAVSTGLAITTMPGPA
jgi:hypothetical protein